MKQLEMIKMIDMTGTKISKEKLLEAIRKSLAKDFNFSTEKGILYSVVKLVID